MGESIANVFCWRGDARSMTTCDWCQRIHRRERHICTKHQRGGTLAMSGERIFVCEACERELLALRVPDWIEEIVW